MPIDLRSALGGRARAANTAARAGDYQLLLGAGASIGAVTSRGAVPSARELVQILKKRYPGVPIDDSDSLPRAYQRAVLASSEQDVWRTLQGIFTNTEHQSWFKDFMGLPWRRVWTLNVDDTVENAYRSTGRSKVLTARTISWDDAYSETGHLEVIHLHGHVLDPEPRRLVFSFSEYQKAAQQRPVWDQVLGGVIGTKPLVTVGARLLDDPDIESLFVNSRPTATAPSIIVDPFISEGNEWELAKLGYIVLRCTGEDFSNAWRLEFGLDDEGLDALYAATSVDLPQMTILTTNHVPPVPRAHDYFGGDEPLWADICKNRAALFGWMGEVVEELEEWLHAARQDPVVHLLYGARLTGVSSGVLLIAREARRKHVETVIFDKSSRFNVARFLDFCRGRGPVLLVIDGAADFGDDIDKLANEALGDSNVAIYVLATERPYNDLRIEGRLSGSYSKLARIVPRVLSRPDASSIALKLQRFGRLGSLEPQTGAQRLAHFKGRDIFSALLEVEYAAGFRKRLESELRGLDSTWKRNLLLLLSLAEQEARQVGVLEASFALGLKSEVVLHELRDDEHLTALVEVVADRLIPRQRGNTVVPLVDLMGAADALRELLGMIQRLSPLATRQSLRERNRAAVLVGYLMNARQLQKSFPRGDIDGFYEDLRDTFGDWNGRYWEQRAIYAKATGDWAHAESFAGRAVSLYDDAFTRTTYGTVLINKAESLAALDDETWVKYYSRGKEEFEEAQGREPGNRITVFAFLEAALALLTVLFRGSDGEGDSRFSVDALGVAQDWRQSYSSVRITMNDEAGFESLRRVEKLSARYEALQIPAI
jgi:hypothetical protein